MMSDEELAALRDTQARLESCRKERDIAEAESRRFRSIVEAVAALPESCKHEGYNCWDCGEDLHPNEGEVRHRATCLAMRASAALAAPLGEPVMRDGELVGWIVRK